MAGLAGMLGLSMLQRVLGAGGGAGGGGRDPLEPGGLAGIGSMGGMGMGGLLPMAAGGILAGILKKKGAKTAKPQTQTVLGGASTSAPKTMLGY